GAVLRVLGVLVFHHHLVTAHAGALAVHDLAGEFLSGSTLALTPKQHGTNADCEKPNCDSFHLSSLCPERRVSILSYCADTGALCEGRWPEPPRPRAWRTFRPVATEGRAAFQMRRDIVGALLQRVRWTIQRMPAARVLLFSLPLNRIQ